MTLCRRVDELVTSVGDVCLLLPEVIVESKIRNMNVAEFHSVKADMMNAVGRHTVANNGHPEASLQEEHPGSGTDSDGGSQSSDRIRG
ncbi:hypothetical protein MBANPS3_001035 [Mucor bainieri]